MKFPIIIIALIFFSCNNGNEGNTGIASDTAKATSEAIARSENIAAPHEPLAITPFEMKDDTAFADGSIPATWENAGITDVKGFKLFLKQMQLYIMDNDKEKLAAAIKYPLKDIKNPEELIQNYDAVFTKEVKLSFATINFNQIFRNVQGAMTEGGKVWFAQQGKDFKIIAINY